MKAKEVKKVFSEFKNIPVYREFLRELRGKLEIQTKFDARETVKVPGFSFKRIASATALASLLLGSTGTVFASQASIPGETLYPIKRLVENVRLAAIINQNTKADIRLELAKERLTEINFLLATNATTSAELEENIKEAASNFDSQLERVIRKAEDLERAGELEKALRVNTDIFSSGKNYKKLIEKNRESSFESIKNRLEDSFRETDKATENAKEHMERLRENRKNDNPEGTENASSTSVQIEGQATISNSYNIRDEKKVPDPLIWAAPKNDSREKVDSAPENQTPKNEEEDLEGRSEPERQTRETNSIQIKIEQ